MIGFDMLPKGCRRSRHLGTPCVPSWAISGAGRSSATARSLAEPATHGRLEPSATFWLGAPVFPGGAWSAPPGGWWHTAERSKRAGCDARELLFGTALSRATWAQESRQYGARLNAG